MSDSFSTRIIRVVMLLSGMIYAYGFWLNRSLAFTDFRVLHLGADLASEGRLEDAYVPELFQAAAADRELGNTARELDVFISTPTFAWALWPFTWLSSNVALVVWMILSVVAVFVAIKLLRLPLWAGVVALALPLGIANIYHAQTGFFALLWAAAIHRLCADGKTVPAGLVAGLAVLKPTLLLGVAVWWLVDVRRWYPALLSAFAFGTTLVLATVVPGLGSWTAFLAALDERSELDITYNQPTLGELISRIAGFEVGTHLITQAALLVLAAVALRQVIRIWPDRIDVASGAAVIASVLISPHLLIYDTTLVVIPFAVAVRAGVPARVREQLVAIYVVSSLMMIVSFEPFSSVNAVIAPSTVGLLGATALWGYAIRPDAAISNDPPNALDLDIVDFPKAA